MSKRNASRTAPDVDYFASIAWPQESILFAMVSMMDVAMTYVLLSRGGGMFVESNPVANYFLRYWGPKGMVYFKICMVIFVCVLAQIIARRRPRTARVLLQGATALVAIVVVYSLMLRLQHGDSPTVIEVFD